MHYFCMKYIREIMSAPRVTIPTRHLTVLAMVLIFGILKNLQDHPCYRDERQGSTSYMAESPCRAYGLVFGCYRRIIQSVTELHSY